MCDGNRTHEICLEDKEFTSNLHTYFYLTPTQPRKSIYIYIYIKGGGIMGGIKRTI